MPIFWLLIIVVGVASVGYLIGRSRALSAAGGNSRGLHSLPSYYGWNVFLKSIVPAGGILILWLLAQPFYVSSVVSGEIPDSEIREGSSRGLLMAEVVRTAEG
ncbi:MAG: phosphate ABC transporter permease family protein, partial [Boseongicola sp.]|nr:phosphate ABC transporter permease family protein [Boseongicola sp.]